VHEDCIKAFQELKLGKKLKYVIYTLSTDNKEIIVEKKSHSSDYDEYLAALPEDDCRWAVYDFEYNTNEGTRNKILFYAWYAAFSADMHPFSTTLGPPTPLRSSGRCCSHPRRKR
jgi:hypothetical protein